MGGIGIDRMPQQQFCAYRYDFRLHAASVLLTRQSLTNLHRVQASILDLRASVRKIPQHAEYGAGNCFYLTMEG